MLRIKKLRETCALIYTILYIHQSYHQRDRREEQTNKSYLPRSIPQIPHRSLRACLLGLRPHIVPHSSDNCNVFRLVYTGDSHKRINDAFSATTKPNISYRCQVQNMVNRSAHQIFFSHHQRSSTFQPLIRVLLLTHRHSPYTIFVPLIGFVVRRSCDPRIPVYPRGIWASQDA